MNSEKKHIMEMKIELYKEDGKFCAYISDDCSSGYEICESTKSKCIKGVADYLKYYGEWDES